MTSRAEYFEEARRVLEDYKHDLELVHGPLYWRQVADKLSVSESSISRTRNGDDIPSVVLDALRQAGYLGPLPPKDPRPRVWMRTDDINSALDTFRKAYPGYMVSVTKKLAPLHTVVED